MSPRFQRYAWRSLPVLGLLLALVLVLNWLGEATKTEWLHVDFGLALTIFAINFALRWWTRTDPERRE